MMPGALIAVFEMLHSHNSAKQQFFSCVDDCYVFNLEVIWYVGI